MVLFGYLSYEPLVRIEIGPLTVSPHGMGIALGFALGAWFLLRAAVPAGISTESIYSMLNRAALGAVLGARAAYVLNHPGEFTDNPLEAFMIWKGGISLLGGITGAVLLAIPRMRADGLSFWKVMDLAVPGLALGIAFGRIGDLVIADHLGKPTKFFLGYVCPPPSVDLGSPCNAAVGQAVHQPALYDLMWAAVIFAMLIRLRRTPRYDGLLTMFFGAAYALGRIVEDFMRVDETHGTGLTGSQWTSVAVLGACLYGLLRLRDTPWASGRGATGSVPRRHGSGVAGDPPEVVRVSGEPASGESPSGEPVSGESASPSTRPEGE
ncbi:MAG: prolipoprotein diacylglyceryl transferase [Acidimicrobiia bacterium]